MPEVLQYNDYDPFGKITPNRHGGENYRYGFGGHENDPVPKGDGNFVDFGNYGLDVRIGRRWQMDPMMSQFPEQSPYMTFFNNPIYLSDETGEWPDLPSFSSVQKSYNTLYNQAKKEVVGAYNNTKKAATTTYNNVVKTAQVNYNYAVQKTQQKVHQAIADTKKFVKDNKKAILNTAKSMHEVGEGMEKVGLAGAVAGAPIAGVGAAPGLSFASAGGIVDLGGTVLEMGVELVSGDTKKAGNTLTVETGVFITGKIADKIIPGPDLGIAPLSKELHKISKDVLTGTISDNVGEKIKSNQK